jgi:hypothetical protein
MKTNDKYRCSWRSILGLLVHLTVVHVSALGQDLKLRAQVVPPSPEVSALAKFADTRISKYSGIPEISIPLYTIMEHELEIPLALNYHAGGIRVEERAGWAGLGWALIAGGSISRTLKGLPDEQTQSASGYINHEIVPDELTLNEKVDYYNRSLNGTIDFEQDIFHFKFGNHSGKFVLNKSGDVAFLSASNLKIQFDRNSSGISRWKVWDEYGNQYLFEDTERTVTEAISESRSRPYTSNYYSAWHLSKIITYRGRQVSFSYENYTESYYTRSSQSASYFFAGSSGKGVCGTNRTTNGFTEVSIRGKQLTAIRFAMGEIQIDSKDDRQDAATKRLSGIRVVSHRGRLIKSYSLDHDYYSSGMSNGRLDLPPFIANATPKKRLRLKKITENTASPYLDYKLEYHGNALPHLFSYAQDHWGYYNGRDNRSLIPQYFRFRQANANRLVIPEAAVVGCLKKITYPTGGSITYEMESNKAMVRAGDYYNFFSPIIQEEDQPIYTAKVNQQNPTADFHVEPQESALDTLKLIQYQIHLGDLRDCNGTSRDCMGTLSIYLYSFAEQKFYDLLAGRIKKGSISGSLRLEPGAHYQLRLEGRRIDLSGISAVLIGRKNPVIQEETEQIEVFTGGLRVRSIIKDFGSQTENIQYHYEQPEDDSSSGSLATFPKYDFLNINTLSSQIPGRNDVVVDHCLKVELRSYSQIPLAASGAFFGYSNVKEIKENSQGEVLRTDYQYISPKDYPDQTRYVFPFGIIYTAEVKRGVPSREVYYVQTENGFKKSKEMVFVYHPTDRVSHENYVFSCMGYGPLGCQDVHLLKYFNTTVWNPLMETREISYEVETGNTFEKSSTVDYDETYLLPIRKTSLLTQNHNIEENFFYPFNSSLASTGSKDQHHLIELIAVNRIAPSLAIIKKTEGQLVEQQQLQLKKYHGKILPVKFTKKHGEDLDYQELTILSYDQFGNIQEQQPRTGPIQSFLWFEGGNYMAAAVQNAAVGEICYTSFESEEKGGWTYEGEPIANMDSKTGNHRYLLSRGAITKANIPADKKKVFLLSFWAKKTTSRPDGTWTFLGKTEVLTDKWQLVQREVTADKLSIEGQGVLVDELRLHPKDAFMETYTYEPLVGITSHTDQRHYTSYYEYDGMGRLATIRNRNKEIMEHYAYTYQSAKK